MFNVDISRWDVSRVSFMDKMFLHATSFKQQLCGAAWVRSRASKIEMFVGSYGSISQTVCTSAKHTLPTMGNTRRYVSRRPNSERELVPRTSNSTLSITPAINNMMTCTKCGTFEKSGRASCCASGGAWYNKCGGPGNRNVEHRWFQGVEACERKSKADGDADT